MISSWIDTAGRLLIVAFFVMAWFRNRLTYNVEDHVKRLALFKCPMPRQAFWVGMILNAIGSTLILINWHAAVGVLVLIIFTVLATLLLLRFWEMDDPIKRIPHGDRFPGEFQRSGRIVAVVTKCAVTAISRRDPKFWFRVIVLLYSPASRSASSR